MRRKSPRVVWLPPNDGFTPNPNPTLGINSFALDISMAAPTVTGEIPIVIDSDDDPLSPTTSLSDMESSGYRLRRIVGKIWVLGDPDDEESNIDAIAICAGIMVRRTDPTSGASLASGNSSLTNPAEINNASDPWIWRRSWLIAGQNGGPFDGLLPHTNFGQEGSSALDGPHVDQKTARIVSSEERVFLDVSANVIFGAGQGEIINSTRIISEFRILASMRTSSGNRRNASR